MMDDEIKKKLFRKNGIIKNLLIFFSSNQVNFFFYRITIKITYLKNTFFTVNLDIF